MGNEPLGKITDWDIDLSQSNNWYGDEQCAGIDYMAWLDKSCTDINPSVCFHGEKHDVAILSEEKAYD